MRFSWFRGLGLSSKAFWARMMFIFASSSCSFLQCLNFLSKRWREDPAMDFRIIQESKSLAPAKVSAILSIFSRKNLFDLKSLGFIFQRGWGRSLFGKK